MRSLDAIIFDFDNALVNTTHLRGFRERGDFAAITGVS